MPGPEPGPRGPNARRPPRKHSLGFWLAVMFLIFAGPVIVYGVVAVVVGSTGGAPTE